MKNYFSINYFENEKYRIKKIKDEFLDKFEINEIEDELIIKRVDQNKGWGANLRVKIFNKVINEEFIQKVGDSEENIKKIKLKTTKSTSHYENDIYKLYVISNYNDIFNIKYNEKTKRLKIIRIDKKVGWNQNLMLEYYEKETTNIKHIQIGSHKEHIKELTIDFNEIEYKMKPNHYDNKYIEINIKNNEYKDEFDFSYDEKRSILKIQRIDSNEGWGQHLKIELIKKDNQKKYIIYIGSSTTQIKYKKIYFSVPNVNISLTTIPSRINLLIKNLNNFIKEQSYEINKIFVNIPIKYKRFKENINQQSIEELKKINKVEIIILDEDYGPSSKYLGPLMKYKEKLSNELLIIIDDDRKYNKNLVRNFVIASQSFPQYEFYAGLWGYFFNDNYKILNNEYLEITKIKEKNEDNFYYGNGLGGFFGFCLKLKNIDEFINYHLTLLKKYEKSFYHDEGISLGYIKKKECEIVYLKHIGCYSYKEESIDALCLSGKCNRKKVEKDILYISNNENLL